MKIMGIQQSISWGVEQNNNIVGISWDINDLETMTTETSWEKMEIYIYI
jgi:hypothetical protein